MQVLVIGSGYVGLVAAAGFADSGHRVLGVDVDAAKIEKLRKGISPIYEPGLDELLKKYQDTGSLSFTLDLKEGIAEADAAFICVGTPQSEDGSADLQYVLSVAQELGKSMACRTQDAKPLIVLYVEEEQVAARRFLGDAELRQQVALHQVERGDQERPEA